MTMKVECPRCLNGKGHIRAFTHVQGGVCFKCGGAGFVERKTAPKKRFWFRCWTMLDGEGAFRYSLKAPSEKQAMTKLRKFIEKAAAKGIGYDLQNYRVELDASRPV
jgi:hypothetical protein